MNEFNEILEIILVEYWFISWPIILIGIIIGHYFNKKRFKEEDILLNKMGFNRTTESLKLSIPSKGWFGGKNINPITSEKYPHILIYLREISQGEGGVHQTRILRLKSKKIINSLNLLLERRVFLIN